MTRVVIDHGICGFETKIAVEKNPEYTVTAEIESTCPNLSVIPSELLTFDPVIEMTSAGTLHGKLVKYITHRSCLIVSGLIKAAEVEAGLALRKDACIRFVD